MHHRNRTSGRVHTRLPRAAHRAVEQLECRRLLAWTPASYTPTMQELAAMDPQPLGAEEYSLSALPGDDFEIEAAPQVYSGGLNGRVVFTSGGHGWQWSTTLNRYATDRGDNNEIVEDFGNQEQMTYYADHLLRAGATVVPMRPIGRQLNEVVVDNDSAGVTFTGTWSNSVSTRYYDEDYGAVADTVPYRFASTVTGAESAVATYTPNIPAAGFYPVYTWVLRSTDRTSQLYRINHSGGSAEIRVDHSKVGSGWVYLGTYHFNNGSSASNGSVQISNNAAVAGKVVIADAIRFGNGMGDYVGTNAPGISGKPREDENSYHWIARMIGQGASVSSIVGTGNVSAPSNMAEYMFAGTFGEALYVGIHSNAGGGRGAVGLIDTDTGDRTPNQASLATYLGRQINQDFQNLVGVFEHNWSTRSTHTFTGQFGEIDLGGGAEMDATIIEIAFHDSSLDAQLMRDPKVRDQIARSMYQATIEYFQNHGSLAVTTSLPTLPVNVRAVSNASGAVTVNWNAGPTSPTSVYGAAATGYKIYTSPDGYGYELRATVGNVTTTTLTGLNPGAPIYIKVAATNAGGESGASEVMTALPSGGAKKVLIVNGFDRNDRTQNFRYAYPHTGDGLVDRVWGRWNNSFDYIINTHNAIHAAKPGTSVASTSNEAVINGSVNLADYPIVIWMLGNESTADRTFDATEQSKVEQFIGGGGHFFVSGSEIAWDLDQQNNGRSFYENTLKGNYVADAAGTNTATVDAGGIFAGLASVVFSSGSSSTAYSSLTTQMYNVNSADVIAAQSGAQVALVYNNGSGAAGIQVQGTGGRGNIVMLAFPFETMTNATRRQQVMGRALEFFTGPPAPGTPDLLGFSDTGVSQSDNLTSRNNSAGNTMQFIVPDTITGTTLEIYAGNTLIGTQSVTGTPTLIGTNGTSTLADGVYAITAKHVSGSESSDPSPALMVTIDATPPTASLGGQQPTAGNATFDFTITYADANGVNAATFDSNDVTVTGPNGFDANAAFISNAGNVVTYRIDAPGGTWNFADNGTYTVSQNANEVGDNAANTRPAGAIGTFNVSVPFAWVHSNGLHVENGSATIARNGSNVDVTQGATLSFPSANFSSIVIDATTGDDHVSFGGVITQPVTFNGGGSGADQLTMNPGWLTLANDAGAGSTTLDITVSATASLLFGASQTLATLQVNGNATLAGGGNKVIVTQDLLVSGRLDLKDNAMVWDYESANPLGTWNGSQYTGAIGLVANARTGGTWSGNGVVTSMSDAAGTLPLTTIAVAEASDLPGISPFAGVTLDGTAVVFKYTYTGDATLDGLINGDDFFALDSAYPNSGSVFGQSNGDFDLNGLVDADDYFLIDANYGKAEIPL